MTHNANGTATISGIPSHHVKPIFTAAWLFRNQKDNEVRGTDYAEWLHMHTTIMDMVLKTPPFQHGYEFKPAHKLRPHERAYRLRAVRDARAQRLDLERIMESLMPRT